MIHHLSISAQEPSRVASVLAAIMGGTAFPFPPHPGSYIALCADAHSTAIEVYPLETVMIPGEGNEEVRFVAAPPSPFVPTHAAVSVPMDEAGIQAMALREGWRAVTCDRGNIFQVVEFWVENRVLIEFLTPEMARSYLRNVTPALWAEYLNQPE